MSDLGALRILRARLHVPPSGAWLAQVQLDSGTLPPLGPTVLAIGDLALVGVVTSASHDDHPGGGLVAATVRGGAGWARPVARGGIYASDSVRLLTVLADIAAMAGEAYAAPADASLGVGYRWEAHSSTAPVHCADVLHDLVIRGYLPTWRVDPAGVTRFDAWPALGAADGRGRITERARARGRRSVGLDVQVRAFLPGATLEGLAIKRSIIHEHAGELRAEVYDQ